MSRYIPFDKMQKLREAAKNGDEMAKKIIRAQLSDDEDFSCDLDAYFAPHASETIEETAQAEPEELKQQNSGTALDVFKNKLDVHGEGNVVIISEKGQLDNPDSPKLKINVTDEEIALLEPEFHNESGVETSSKNELKQNVITGPIQENEISDGILNLISACDKKTLEIANDTEISDATKKGALSILQEIKQSCLDNLEKFGKLMSSISKKQVEEEEEIQ